VRDVDSQREVRQRALVSGDDLLDRHSVTPANHPVGDARGVDPRVARRDEEHPDEVACLASAMDELHLVGRRKDGLEGDP
jgi:hypothetical protein